MPVDIRSVVLASFPVTFVRNRLQGAKPVSALFRAIARSVGIAAVVYVAGDLPASDAEAAAVTIPAGRFEFAPVPEHVFVARIAETVQLGIRQIDPLNRWPAGDQTRASGWTSRYPTRLVNAATGAAVSGFKYDSASRALRYAGTFRGDVSVRLERTDVPIRSNTFRLRALEPGRPTARRSSCS